MLACKRVRKPSGLVKGNGDGCRFAKTWTTRVRGGARRSSLAIGGDAVKRLNRPAFFRVAASALLVGVAHDWAAGGVRRHDRADALHIDLAADERLSAVGRVTVGGAEGTLLGSGTLIQDQWVLTAAHVVDGLDGFGGGVTDVDFDLAGESFAADEWFLHPDWAASGGENNLFAGWDIALVRLDRPATSALPAPLYTGSDELGQVGTIVGFGAAGTGLSGAVGETAGVKRAGQNMVDLSGLDLAPGSSVSIEHDRMLAVDFDRPGDRTESTLGSPLPLELEYLSAPGDSGGGLFLDVDGEMLLAGVTSLGSTLDGSVDSDYGDRAAFTRVSRFLGWIDSVIAEHTPLEATSQAGDFNGDGVVDASDYTLWRDSLGSRGEGLRADGDGDGVVGAGDFELWASNFGAVATGRGELAPAVATPEPAALLLFTLGIAAAFPFRARNGREPQAAAGHFDTDLEGDVELVNDAIFYLLVGVDARRRLARGAALESVGHVYQMTTPDLCCAILFACAPRAVLLRAFQENWSWAQIQQALLE